MMKTFSFYDTETGLFTGASLTVNAQNVSAVLAANTREGCAAIEGQYDHRARRVDLSTGRRVVDDPDMARTNAEKRERQQLQRTARQRIDELERKTLRPLRELAIDAKNAQARERLREIEVEIAGLRTEIT